MLFVIVRNEAIPSSINRTADSEGDCFVPRNDEGGRTKHKQSIIENIQLNGASQAKLN